MQTSLSTIRPRINSQARAPTMNGTLAIQRLADRLNLRCVQAEREVIGTLWMDPEAGLDAAVDASLTALSFSDLRLRVLFVYLCVCAESNIKPTVKGALLWLETLEPGLVTEWEGGWVERVFGEVELPGDKPIDCRKYARRLRHLSDIRRVHAPQTLDTFTRLCGDDEYDVVITENPLNIRNLKYDPDYRDAV